ncbi:MAG: hypothetical protein RIQ63_1376 [Actinomycetota bacterium]
MHRRNRAVSAVVVTGLLTALMWTDSPTTWWSSIIEFFMTSNSSVTSTVMDVRPSGDLDLHVLVWAMASCVWWWALRQGTTVLRSLFICSRSLLTFAIGNSATTSAMESGLASSRLQ